MTLETAGDGLVTCDVLVIGGGPAGSTIAALLAERGKSVALVDKDRHPRFHIGESLLPFNMPLFDALGVREEIERMGMPKFGIEFVSPHHAKPSLLEFRSGWRKEMDYSFQVRRSDFDHILLRNAAAKGAAVVEACRITEIEFPEAGGAVAAGTDENGTVRRWQARFVVDATGRDTFLASKLKRKQRNRRHESAAIFGHFTGAERLEGRAEGNISIFWFDKGWFWFIPLADGATSVGAVCKPETFKDRDGDVTSLFMALIASCPALAHRLRDATLAGPATATGNYSYESDSMIGERYILVGDASSFIDPVFSTGVFLAMRSAFLGVDAVMACLDEPARAPAALQRFEREVKGGIDRFSWFIYRITSPAIRSLFMAPRNFFRMEEAVLSLLAGDIAGNSPIRSRLFLFKQLYYAKTGLAGVGRFFGRFLGRSATGAIRQRG
ncbi:MAG TPA: NAD(P)/FAD-dependent oxidoreductase [Aliidongia sp.]|nr:NAD(P)/FAD-dependent oxidoreductase [Aliidongia sp.]